MKITIDTSENSVTVDDQEQPRRLDLYSRDAFELISQVWLKVGWNEKYTYTFSWFGRPIIQLPEDLVRIQEVIYRVQPDVIIETGVAHGGSLVFYAGLCKVLGKGRVIGVDVEIRPHNRTAIESHPLYPLITLVEGNSVAPEIVRKVKAMVRQGETVLVILDSLHTKEHVLAELDAYHGLVSKGSYLVATDGIMGDVYDTPRGHPTWKEGNPASAAREFAEKHPEFVIEKPSRPFNESKLDDDVTYWPNSWLLRK